MNRNLVGSIYGRSSVSEKIFKKSSNQKQELPVVAMFVNGLGQKSGKYSYFPGWWEIRLILNLQI
jgi:hypothetical protein